MLTRSDAVKFKSGQWLDVHVPSIPKPGGFTITSAPELARPSGACLPRSSDTDGGRPNEFPESMAHDHPPHFELAVQNALRNPPAAWLWQSASEILGQTLHVRVGGSFVWPPPARSEAGVLVRPVKGIVMIAGGVGIKSV